jgi:TPR repeat protein
MQEALKWNRKAAAKNEPRALYELALYYLSDKTNRGSIALASDYMLRAAKGGNREAQFQCAMNCFRGDAGAQDFENGKQWLAKAAENDWPKAEFCLFQLYYHGVPPGPGCPSYPKDKVAAVKWLRRAAQHESLQAQAVLAIMLVRGSEVEQDKVEAEKLLRYAAPHGYPEAQNDLGFAILHGDFSGADLVEAAMWCQLAVSGSAETNTIRRAKVNLSDALSRLSADQQLEVDRRVKSFRILHSPETDPMSKGWEQNPDYAQEDDQVTSR